jgi:hypothetical protein
MQNRFLEQPEQIKNTVATNFIGALQRFFSKPAGLQARQAKRPPQVWPRHCLIQETCSVSQVYVSSAVILQCFPMSLQGREVMLANGSRPRSIRLHEPDICGRLSITSGD